MKESPLKETITLNLMGDNTYSIKMKDSQTDQLKIRSGTAEAKPVFNKISHSKSPTLGKVRSGFRQSVASEDSIVHLASQKGGTSQTRTGIAYTGAAKNGAVKSGAPKANALTQSLLGSDSNRQSAIDTRRPDVFSAEQQRGQ